jgi:hypothetical protein
MRALFLMIVFLTTPLVSEAQVEDSFSMRPEIDIVVQPSYPEPEQLFTAKFDEFRSYAQGAEMEWYYNNEILPEAKDKSEVTLIAPPSGETATIALIVRLESGQFETYKKTIAPLYLDIVVEAQTHIPAFYAGRALPSIGSMTTFTALISGDKLLGNNFIYTWELNGNILEGGPLRNQNKIGYLVPYGKNYLLPLQVARYDRSVIAERSILIPSVKPEILFYEKNPLFGLNTRSITNGLDIIGDSATIQAEPYYLGSTVFNNPNILEWEINNKLVEAGYSNPYEITLQKTGYPGNALLGFHVRSTVELLQGAERKIEIKI